MPLLCRRPALFACNVFEDRRLADGKDPTADELGGIEQMSVPQADALDQIDELTVVISPTTAPAAGVRQKTEQFSNSDAKLFYP